MHETIADDHVQFGYRRLHVSVEWPHEVAELASNTRRQNVRGGCLFEMILRPIPFVRLFY